MPATVPSYDEFSSLQGQVTSLQNSLTLLSGQIQDHEERISELETGAPPEPPESERPTMTYWLPGFMLDEGIPSNMPVGHCWWGNWGYLEEARKRNMKVDYELALHQGGNENDVRSRLQEIVNRGFTDVINRVMMIDEPDIHPAGTWDMNMFRRCYTEAKKIHDWPVWVLVRAHSSTWDLATPWFPNDLCDVIAWDPYLAHYGSPNAENYIRSEGNRLRGALPTGKPLVCVVQAGIVEWACPPGVTPKPIPSTHVKLMGEAALEVGATANGLWFEYDLPDKEGDPVPESWTNVEVATVAWDSYIKPTVLKAPLFRPEDVPFHIAPCHRERRRQAARR